MVTAIAGAAASMIGGLFQGFGARKAARKQERRSKKLQRDLNRLEANRQDIIDPSRNIVDRSSLISNTMGNLQVSTQAAEFQAEEADLSLASTLDTLRATGAGAGGATALAQAALRSKADIASTIDQQEAQNARLRAQHQQMRGQLLQQQLYGLLLRHRPPQINSVTCFDLKIESASSSRGFFV